MNEKMRNHHNNLGFTLIELLVSVAIIGILAAIAFPQFNSYRKRAYDSKAISDLGNVRAAQEAYFADNEFYASSISNLTGFQKLSNNVNLVFNINADYWEGSSYHIQGSKTFCYKSSDSDGTISQILGLAETCP